MVRYGLAFFDFETTLEHMPGTILQRGLYKQQLDRYVGRFPREQLHVVIFEEFRAAPQRVLDELCTFLGLDPGVRISESGGSRYNAATAVRHPRLHRGANLVLQGALGRSRTAQTPTGLPAASQSENRGGHRIKSLLFDSGSSYPPMASDTRERLSRFYARENAGLTQLLGREPAELWTRST
jgi:hypothetical protein